MSAANQGRRYHCGLCGQEGHNKRHCGAAKGGAAAPTNVIQFGAARQPDEPAKQIKASRRDLCIGDDLVAVRQVFKNVADVQVETIFSEGMAVARSRQWEVVILAVRDVVDPKVLQELVAMNPAAPVVVITSRLTVEMSNFYLGRDRAVACALASDIASGAIDLCTTLDKAIAFVRERHTNAEQEKREQASGVRETSRALIKVWQQEV